MGWGGNIHLNMVNYKPKLWEAQWFQNPHYEAHNHFLPSWLVVTKNKFRVSLLNSLWPSSRVSIVMRSTRKFSTNSNKNTVTLIYLLGTSLGQINIKGVGWLAVAMYRLLWQFLAWLILNCPLFTDILQGVTAQRLERRFVVLMGMSIHLGAMQIVRACR